MLRQRRERYPKVREPREVIWNLFLALVPVALGFLVAGLVRQDRERGKGISWPVAGPLLVIWLLFLPNTCYLLTEWRHYLETVATNPGMYFSTRHNAGALFQFLLISVFYIFYSGCGMVTFFLAIWPVDRVFHIAWWGKAIFFLLCSLGVYLGLVKRFNSWQIVHHFSDIVQSTLAAVARPEIDLLMLVFAGMLWITYVIFEIFMDGIEVRRRRLLAK